MRDADITSTGVNRRTFIKGAGAAVGTPALGTAAAGAEEGSAEMPRLIAHRGYAGRYPENTLEAVESASKTTDMIEIDIIPTADGRVVVFHDDCLSGRDGGEQGLTDLDGYVWERPWEDVRGAEVLESGETVPSLEAVLEAIPSAVGINIEFKNPGSADIRIEEKLPEGTLEARKDLWRPMAKRALDLAAAADNEILVSSFAEAALAVVREIDPSVPIAFLFSRSIGTALEVTTAHDCEALHPSFELIEGTTFFSGKASSPDLLGWAHDRGKAVNAWTVGTWYEAERLADAGVDGLIVDYPYLLE